MGSGSDWEDQNINEPTDQDLKELSKEDSSSETFNEEFDEFFRISSEAVDKVDQLESKLDAEDKVLDTDWSLFTVANLKIELKKRGLKSTGRKAELVKILEEFDLGLTKEQE